jgi:hypothetical protein
MPETENIIRVFFELFFTDKNDFTSKMDEQAVDISENGDTVTKQKYQWFKSKRNFIDMTSG